MLTRNARWPGPGPQDRKPGPATASEATLLRAVETFLHRHRMRQAAFCRGAGVNSRLIYALRQGVMPKPETEAKVRVFMARLDREAGS